MFRQISRENRNAHFYSITFFFRKSDVQDINLLNIVEPGRPQMAIWRTRTTSRLPKAIHKPSECKIRIAFPLQQWLHESASMLCYTQIAFLVQIPLFLCYITIHLAYNE